MIWILILLGLVAAAISSPRFRTALVVILVVAGGLAWWLYSQDQRELEASRTRIPPAEVELVGFALAPSWTIGGYTLSGRVRNGSKRFTLTGLTVVVRATDCVESRCETVGEERLPLSVDIPPNQARDLSAYLNFRDLANPRGTLSFTYTVTETTARESH